MPPLKRSLLRALTLASLLLASLTAYHLAYTVGVARRAALERTRLAPFHGVRAPPAYKDVAAYALVSLPRLGRLVRTGTARYPVRANAARLEGFHEDLQFSAVGNRFKRSDFFAENFYIWVQSPAADFVLTTRLSFYGRDAANVLPWFTLCTSPSKDADAATWSLPSDFERRVRRHAPGDARVAVADGLGELYFEVVEPLRKWVVAYRGVLERASAGGATERAHVDARFELDLSPDNLFFFNVDVSELTMARAMAVNEWDAAFWRSLVSQNQERYASRAASGSGYVAFLPDAAPGSAPRTNLSLPAVVGSRDHNFGVRNWRFMHAYIWWPPTNLDQPLTVDGVKYSAFVGTFVEYGRVFSNLVVGGLVSDAGDVLKFSAATPMDDIAREWARVPSPGKHHAVGDALVPAELAFTVALGESAEFALDCELVRGKGAGLWRHVFWLQDGDFEIHEALTRFTFKVRRWGESAVLSRATAVGMFEFGRNVVGLDDAA